MDIETKFIYVILLLLYIVMILNVFQWFKEDNNDRTLFLDTFLLGIYSIIIVYITTNRII